MFGKSARWLEIRLTLARKGQLCAGKNLGVPTGSKFAMAAQWCTPPRRQHAGTGGTNAPSAEGMTEAAHNTTTSALDRDRRIRKARCYPVWESCATLLRQDSTSRKSCIRNHAF